MGQALRQHLAWCLPAYAQTVGGGERAVITRVSQDLARRPSIDAGQRGQPTQVHGIAGADYVPWDIVERERRVGARHVPGRPAAVGVDRQDRR